MSTFQSLEIGDAFEYTARHKQAIKISEHQKLILSGPLAIQIENTKNDLFCIKTGRIAIYEPCVTRSF